MTDQPQITLEEPIAELDPNEHLYNAIVTGTFVEADESVAFYTIGDGQRASVSLDEHVELPKPGDEVSLLVEVPVRGIWRASIWKAIALGAWNDSQKLARQGGSREVVVVAASDSGLVVDAGMRGFIPRSQIDRYRVEDPSALVGQTLEVKVIDVDNKRGDVILSRRALIEEANAAAGEEVRSQLEVGQDYDGRVVRVMPYGAFVDIGGIEGLLHASNIGWQRVGDPRKVLKSGDKVRVRVLDYDPETGKIGLGSKQLQEDPWVRATAELEVGTKLSAKIVGFARFGAFLELAPGVEGLLHNSELSWTDRSATASKIYEEGQELEVAVIEIDHEDRRVKFSVRQLGDNPWTVFANDHEVGSKITGKVARFAPFGTFIELSPGIDGLLHNGDISWTERVEDASERFEVGQELELILLEIDPARGRAGLGLKQIDGDPWEKAAEVAVVGQKIDVEIVRCESFGAFAKIVDGVEGLIHVSELSQERVRDPLDVVTPGKTVNALVISFDRKRRRVGLSLKREALELEEGGEAEEYTDEGEATTTLGDLLRPSSAKESQAPEEPSAEPETVEEPETGADNASDGDEESPGES